MEKSINGLCVQCNIKPHNGRGYFCGGHCRLEFLSAKLRSRTIRGRNRKALEKGLTWRRGRTYVYAIEDTVSKRIKLGVSCKPVDRLRHLQTGSGNPLVLLGKRCLASNVAAYIKERQLHKKFAQNNTKGEWFVPTLELLEEIQGWRP